MIFLGMWLMSMSDISSPILGISAFLMIMLYPDDGLPIMWWLLWLVSPQLSHSTYKVEVYDMKYVDKARLQTIFARGDLVVQGPGSLMTSEIKSLVSMKFTILLWREFPFHNSSYLQCHWCARPLVIKTSHHTLSLKNYNIGRTSTHSEHTHYMYRWPQ